MRVFRDSAASRVRAAAVLGVALVALAGCSSDDGSSAATTTSSAAAPSTSAKSSASSGASANATTSAQGAPNPGTEEATLDYTAATGVVLTEVPGGRITDLRFVVEKGGTYVWEADVIDASGAQRAVDVDAVSGRILQNVPR